jgi:hypothetical protein
MSNLNFAALTPGLLAASEPNSVLIRNVTVHLVTGPEIQSGSVLVMGENCGSRGAYPNALH